VDDIDRKLRALHFPVQSKQLERFGLEDVRNLY
jgi:hypothetical protein